MGDEVGTGGFCGPLYLGTVALYCWNKRVTFTRGRIYRQPLDCDVVVVGVASGPTQIQCIKWTFAFASHSFFCYYTTTTTILCAVSFLFLFGKIIIYIYMWANGQYAIMCFVKKSISLILIGFSFSKQWENYLGHVQSIIPF